MIFNYQKLLGKIVEVYGKQSAFALEVGLSERSLSLKLNNKRHFRQDEIFNFCNALNIPLENVSEYFFALKVQ